MNVASKNATTGLGVSETVNIHSDLRLPPRKPSPTTIPRISSVPTMNHTIKPYSVNETTPIKPLLEKNQSMWSRMFRHFTGQSPMIHRLLPKIKSGRLLLELNNQSEWKHFEVVLAGSNIGDLGLYYYANKTDQAPVGCILLHSAHIDVLEEVVMVVTQKKTWFLCAAHGREASEWAEAICATIENTSQGVLSQGPKVTSPATLRNSTGSLSATTPSSTSSERRRFSGNASAVTVREIQRRDPRARVDEFLEIFVHSNAEDIRLQATEGALSWSCMRNVTWKLWLEYLPTNQPFLEWIPSTRTKRSRYEALQKEYCPFVDTTRSLKTQQEFILACESTEDVLLYSIYKDVRRTRGTMEFFRGPGIQCLLMRVLYTYSRAHPEISYNQGMGELLATLVYLLHVEQWPTSESSSKNTTGLPKTSSEVGLYDKAAHGHGSTDSLDSDEYVYVESFIDIQGDATYLDQEHFLKMVPFTGGSGKYSECCREAVETILQVLTSADAIEHDSYLLLEEIMFRMAGAYCPEVENTPNCHPRFRRQSSSTTVSTLTLPSQPPNTVQTDSGGSEWTTSPLYDQMNSIHNQILSRCDPPTARHLAKLGVEPQMFVLRWVRVLMSREFEMVHVWQIWDAIFSLTPSDFSFINLLCVAAVREFREEILQVQDPTGVLLCLRDLSGTVQADRLVDNARELHDALMIAAAVEATNGME